MKHDFALIAIEVRDRGRGWNVVGRDISDVAKPGQRVKLEGTAGLYPAYVVKHDPDRRLIYVKHDGYTSYLNRGTGNSYSPAEFVVYEYQLVQKGNEQHPYVSLFGIAELPLKWRPDFAAEGRY